MTENRFGPRENEADDRTRVSYPRPQTEQPSPQGQPAAAQPFQQPVSPQQAPAAAGQQYGAQQQGFAPAGYGSSPYGQGGQSGQQGYRSFEPPKKAGYFRSLFDLGYDNLGAPKFARVFQLLFMIVSGLAAIVGVMVVLRGDAILPIVLAIVVVPLLWLLLNTFIRLVLEGIVGIVQTAENTEEMLRIMRETRGS